MKGIVISQDDTISVSTHSSKSERSERSERSGRYTVTTRQRWPSTWAYICSSMACSCSLHYFVACYTYRLRETESFLHYMVGYIIVGLPTHYLQTLLGQYTQTGIRLVKYLAPIAGGVSITFATNLFFHCIMNGLLLGDVCIYFLSSMRTSIQWMRCPQVVDNITCWDGTGCMKNCIGEFNQTSAFHYFFKIYMEGAEPNAKVPKIIAIPSLSRTALITSSWIMTCILITIVSTSSQKFFIITWNIIFSLITFNAIAAIINVPKDLLGSHFFNIEGDNFWHPKTWSLVFTKTIYSLSLGRPFHVTHGSYMTSTSSSGLTSSCTVFYSFTVLVLSSTFSRCTILKLQRLANLDANYEKYLWDRPTRTYFVTIPFTFGLTSVPHFWLLQYFFMFMCIVINNQLTHMFAFERVLAEYFPALIRYRRYILGGIAIIAGLISVCLSSKETYLLFKSISLCVSETIEVFNTLALSIIVCYVYGVEKFCDDVDFMRGAQPSKYWKICWYALPVMLGITYFYRKSAGIHSEFIENIEHWVLLTLISPILIVAVIEILKYIRQRNILGLFQNTSEYGPPDPTERFLRRIYNPRRETRATRKRENCLHNCILNNKILKRIEEEEVHFKRGREAT